MSDRLPLLEAMVLDDLPNLKDTYASLYSSAMEDLEVDFDSGLEEDELKQEAAPEDSTIFVAFKGNIGDRDFEQKLDTILENVPGLLHMGNVPSYNFSTVLKIFIYVVRVLIERNRLYCFGVTYFVIRFVGVILSEFGSCSSQRDRVQVSAVVLLFKTDFISEFIYSCSVPMFYLGFFSLISHRYTLLCYVKVKPGLSTQMFFTTKTIQFKPLQFI